MRRVASAGKSARSHRLPLVALDDPATTWSALVCRPFGAADTCRTEREYSLCFGRSFNLKGNPYNLSGLFDERLDHFFG